MAKLSAIISGGGIGALATATALCQRGWTVTVCESRPEIRVSGSGIYMRDNGLAVLSHLGAYDRAMRDPFLGRGVIQIDRDGQEIVGGEMPPGMRIVAIPRSDLIAGLEAAARAAGATILTGAEVVDARADGTLVFANGSSLRGDLAIGADGVWSATRRALGLEESRMRSLEGALRTIIPATQDDMPEAYRGFFVEQWNGRRRVLVTPVNDREIYLALTCPESDEAGRQTTLDASWSEQFPMWKHLFERIEAPMTWGVYTVIKSKSWSAGRACIVGDAAHATTPNLGQGGGMAMQNGLALASFMAKVQDARDIPEALCAWEARMRPHIDQCQHWATMFGEIANIPDDARARIVRAAYGDPWVGHQLMAMAVTEPLTEIDWEPRH